MHTRSKSVLPLFKNLDSDVRTPENSAKYNNCYLGILLERGKNSSSKNLNFSWWPDEMLPKLRKTIYKKSEGKY